MPVEQRGQTGGIPQARRGRAGVIKPATDLQELRARIGQQAKSAGTKCTSVSDWVDSDGVASATRSRESRSARRKHKPAGRRLHGKRSAGNPHAPFDRAGAGDGSMAMPVRHSQRKRGETDMRRLPIPRQPATLPSGSAARSTAVPPGALSLYFDRGLGRSRSQLICSSRDLIGHFSKVERWGYPGCS
jgi:hypothetical protein